MPSTYYRLTRDEAIILIEALKEYTPPLIYETKAELLICTRAMEELKHRLDEFSLPGKSSGIVYLKEVLRRLFVGYSNQSKSKL